MDREKMIERAKEHWISALGDPFLVQHFEQRRKDITTMNLYAAMMADFALNENEHFIAENAALRAENTKLKQQLENFVDHMVDERNSQESEKNG